MSIGVVIDWKNQIKFYYINSEKQDSARFLLNQESLSYLLDDVYGHIQR